MERFVQSGNIVKSHVGAACGCTFSGYVEYSQEMTFLRKYSHGMPFYNDETFIYKEPKSKAKNPGITLDLDRGDRLEVAREYFIRVCGAGRKRPLQGIYEPQHQFNDKVLILNRGMAAALRSFSWNEEPVFLPLRLMSANGKLISEAGDYELFAPRPRQDVIRDTPEAIDLHRAYIPCPQPCLNVSIISRERVAAFNTDAIRYMHSFDFRLARGSAHTRYFFSLRALEKLLTLDPELVFLPVFTTENIEAHCQSKGDEPMSLSADVYSIREALTLQAYCQRWCRAYDEEAFARTVFPTLRWVKAWLAEGNKAPELDEPTLFV